MTKCERPGGIEEAVKAIEEAVKAVGKANYKLGQALAQIDMLQNALKVAKFYVWQFGRGDRDLEMIEKALTLTARDPDFIYDPDDWEMTYSWGDRDLLAEEYFEGGRVLDRGPVEYATLIKGPAAWAVEVALTRDEDGDPITTEIRWFTSLKGAQAADNAHGKKEA